MAKPPAQGVSIHASTWEATLCRAGTRCKSDCFNPRLHMGGDWMGEDAIERLIVSIHASTWEATYQRRFGGDGKAFQSTPPHGRRPAIRADIGTMARFNPRLHMGGDLLSLGSIHPNPRFQSTPPHGRRRGVDASAAGGDVSIHASTWEATTKSRKVSDVMKFQSTPPHGRRRYLFPPPPRCDSFQSTPPHGRRRTPSSAPPNPPGFNPRLHMGGDAPACPSYNRC